MSTKIDCVFNIAGFSTNYEKFVFLKCCVDGTVMKL
jgi:hypothetical protein